MKILKIKKVIENFSKIIISLNFLNCIFSKILIFYPKYSNFFLNEYDFKKKNNYLYSYPIKTNLNTTNICNYRCKFCEIHYFYKFGKEHAGIVYPNHIDLNFVKKFEKLFDKTISIELSGASGEPFLNPYFINICKKFKEKKIKLSVTTNGSLLTKNIAESLVDMNFDKIMISLHSGEEENYRELQGGDFNKILNNIKSLIKIRNKKGFKFPYVSINCIIFKLNQFTIKKLIKIMKELNVDALNFNHYYASRNIIKEQVSFYFNPDEGNKLLKDIYEYAKKLDLKLTPKEPEFIYIGKKKTPDKNKNICKNPWSVLKLKGCVEYENSHYVCVCNRILLFRLNYEEFNGNFIKDIWNHEIIRFLRKNVNNNPICQFCRDYNTPILRCINNKQYQIKRDDSIRKFFTNALRSVKIKQRKGIYLLNKNPYEYKD